MSQSSLPTIGNEKICCYNAKMTEVYIKTASIELTLSPGSCGKKSMHKVSLLNSSTLVVRTAIV